MVGARGTADLVDAYRNSGRLQSCAMQFMRYGGRASFFGPVRTIKTYEDNALIKQVLSGPGQGSVLVVDGGGSLRRALVGDVIGGLGVSNGWAGVVLFGAVRDVVALGRLDLGVVALGSNPWPSGKTGAGTLEATLRFGDVTIAPGSWLYCDEDGMLVADGRLD